MDRVAHGNTANGVRYATPVAGHEGKSAVWMKCNSSDLIGRLVLSACILLVPAVAPAATTDLAGSGAWTALLSGDKYDPNGDTQAAKAGTEIVGNATHPSFYINYDDNGTTGGPTPEADDILSFRLRIGDETKSTHSSYAFFGIEASGDGTLDVFVSSGAGTTEIWYAGADDNISPNTTDLANSADWSYPQIAANYNFALVSAANDPDWDGNDNLNADGNTDVFVSFSIPVVDLADSLADQGITFTPTTQLRFVSLTATQTNALNSDFNGVSDSGTDDWDLTYAALGLMSDPVDSEGVIDTTPPVTPTVTAQLTNDSTPVMSGTAEASTTVTIVVAGATYTTTATGGSTWSVDTGSATPTSGTFNPNVNGSNEVVVTSADAVGNSSSDVTSNELVIDTTDPATPTVTVQTTNDSTPVLSGTAEAGNSVTVVVAGATYSTTATGGGTWSIATGSDTPDSGTFNPNLNGSNEVVVSSTDAAGNSSSDVTTNELVIDTTPPTLFITDNGSGGNDIYVSPQNSAVSISGNSDAEDGRTVTVAISDGVNPPVVTTATVAGGSWTSAAADVSSLNAGALTIMADVSDTAGNPATQATDTATHDPAPPAFSANDVGPTADTTPTLSGTTSRPAGELVTVTDGGGNPVCSATVVAGIPDNTWSCVPNAPLSEGIHSFTASVSDGAGGSYTAVFTVTIDLDGDDDGIPDAVEGAIDSDGDGVPDYLDTDSDNDGIADADEDTGLPVLSGDDSDGDGIDDAVDVDNTGGTDANGNGIDDALEPSDQDADGLPDYLDADTDNDGIPDIIEGNIDTDLDGIPDHRDVDSDADGIPDQLEQTLMPPLSGTDSDSDGIDDTIDVDSTGGSDSNVDGIDDALAPADSDADGLPDHVDSDSDGDGVPDSFGAGNLPPLNGTDSDLDGIDDAIDVDNTGGSDFNGDGVDDALAPADSDLDGISDYLDIDSDGDGIPDTAETGALGLDSDGDGIDDAFDVDQTGGTDANGDGVDDSGPPDFDGDGAPDFLDLDSDNDGRSDVIEAGLVDANGDGWSDGGIIAAALLDSDGFGDPDYLDLDSDNDGTNDIVGTAAEPFDGDGDGQIDPANATDSDGDGVPDVIDGTPGSGGLSSDSDGDGVPADTDIDDDNDGIPDSVEAPAGIDVDSDSDGLFDRLDADSDNDGIPDTIDGSGGHGVDQDGDGILDDLTDTNSDGLADIVATSMMPVDTDGDGIPDYLDLDSDQDGISDLAESATAPVSLDADNDGRLDGGVDADRDGLLDAADPLVSGGTAGTAYAFTDMDGDGRAAYRDLDSDGDNISDAVENGDFDNNGVPDYQQNDDGLETAVTGSGAGGLGIFGLAGLALLLVVRQIRPGHLVMALGLLTLGTSLPQPGQAAETCDWSHDGYTMRDCWYLQAGVGYTLVDPEGQSNGWQTSDDNSHGYKLLLGRHLKPKWFAELSYTDMGEAELDNVNPAITGTPEISYEVAALFAGYWLRKPESRWNLYGKIGLSVIWNEVDDSRVDYDKQNSTQLAFGIGLQWRVNQRWFTRLEYDAFDRDARFTGLSIGAYLGDPPARN